MSSPPDGPSDDARDPADDPDPPTGGSGGEVDHSIGPTDPTEPTSPTDREPAPFGADVDGRWWWWVAAAPVHFAVSLAVGALFFLVAVLGLFTGTAGGGGMGPGTMFSGAVGLLFVAVALVVVLPGIVIAVVLPVALYVDASAVGAAPDVDWEPEAALYGLVALVGLLVSGNLVGVVLATYYLYRRHETVGTP